MPKKRTISISDPLDMRLIRVYKEADSNPSDVIEAALSHFFRLDDFEISQRLKQVADEKQTMTEQGWRRVFWIALCNRLGYVDYRYDSRSPYGPLTLGRFTFVFLLPDMSGHEDGTLTVHAFQMPDQGSRIGENSITLHYLLGDRVSDAVNEVVRWADAHGGAYAPESTTKRGA